MDFGLTVVDLVIPAGFFHCEGVKGINEAYGLRNESRVLKELVRRKLPFQHSIQIGNYEVDFLVGKRIIIEVDGYVHALKDTISKDLSKEEQLKSLGFIILRITGSEAKNQGLLREFGSLVQQTYEDDLARFHAMERIPMKRSLSSSELEIFKRKLEHEAKEQRKTLDKDRKKAIPKEPKLTDEELFLQAVERLGKPRRK